MPIFRILTALVLLSPLVVGAQIAPVKQVDIRSGWGGLGPSRATELSIRSEKGIFKDGHRRIDSQLVTALVSALQEAVIEKPDPHNLGITPEWLKANADKAAAGASGFYVNYADGAPNQKQLFERSFADSAFIAKVLPSLFSYTKFDDYPGASVTVTFEDGTMLSATSHSYYLMMLPWDVTSTDGTWHTFNGNISRSVAALMPNKSVSRERLAGNDLGSQLADAVMRDIEDKWKLLDVENKAGDALAQLRTKYAVETAEINPYHHPEYGKEWDSHTPHEVNLHASLRRPSFPPNVTVALVLPVVDAKVQEVSRFLAEGERYEQLAFSVPWLNDYLGQYRRVQARISYVHNQSFGDKAMRVFTADMNAIGKDALVQQVRDKQADVALLIVGITHFEAYWIVFPDGHLILWRYGGLAGLLKWQERDFPTNKCSEYQGVTGGCVGAVISREGELIH